MCLGSVAVCFQALRATKSFKTSFVVVFLTISAFGQISSEFFGMHIGRAGSDPWPTTEGVEFTNFRTHNSGATHWSQLNPKPGVYAWQQLDTVLQRSEQYGTVVDFVFYYTPSWASSAPTGLCGSYDG